jgi:hypothetical protein
MSLLAATSLAAYEAVNVRTICSKKMYKILAIRKTPMPAKIVLAGEKA